MVGAGDSGALGIIDRLVADPASLIGPVLSVLLLLFTVGLFIWSISERISWGEGGASVFMTAIYLIPAFGAVDNQLGLGVFDYLAEAVGFGSSFIGIAVVFALVFIVPWILCAWSLFASLVFANSAFSLLGGFGSQAYRICYVIYSVIFLVGIPALMFVL